MVSKYKDKFEIAISKIRPAQTEEIAIEDLLPHTAKNIDEMWAVLQDYSVGEV
jgi:hypothetical protein